MKTDALKKISYVIVPRLLQTLISFGILHKLQICTKLSLIYENNTEKLNNKKFLVFASKTNVCLSCW